MKCQVVVFWSGDGEASKSRWIPRSTKPRNRCACSMHTLGPVNHDGRPASELLLCLQHHLLLGPLQIQPPSASHPGGAPRWAHRRHPPSLEHHDVVLQLCMSAEMPQVGQEREEDPVSSCWLRDSWQRLLILSARGGSDPNGRPHAGWWSGGAPSGALFGVGFLTSQSIFAAVENG